MTITVFGRESFSPNWRRLFDEPAGRVSRWASPLSADELFLEYLPDAYLQKIADYFSALRPPPAPQAVADVSAAVLTHGRSLAREGDQAYGLPACVGCHGPRLTGMEPAIPGLVGLYTSYISAQLGAFRYGTRTAPAPDCMQLVAASLTEGDVTAVAAWLASLPIPPTRPLCRRAPCRCRSPAAANHSEEGTVWIDRLWSLPALALFVLVVFIGPVLTAAQADDRA
jgi:cytochrome c553